MIISDRSSFNTSLNFFRGGSTAFLTFDPLRTFRGGWAGADVILADTGGILLLYVILRWWSSDPAPRELGVFFTVELFCYFGSFF
jgi:hypothetical protein